MIDSRDNFVMPGEREKARHEFKFCRLCEFYPCELVGKYTQFRDCHTLISKSQIQQASSQTDNAPSSRTAGSQLIIHATATSRGAESPSRRPHVAPSSQPEGDVPLSYNPTELQDGCIMSGRYVTQVECGRQRVTEGIGDHYKIETQWDYTIRTGTTDRWEPSQPVFISAPTGHGKNYFIEHTLIPYVEDLNGEHNTEQRVLILSNRLALREQIKNRLANGDDDTEAEYDPEEDMKTYHPYGPYVDVMTYQSLLHRAKSLEQKQKQKNARSRYIYVICDEAHFFTSDSMFNPHTSKILEAIVRLFQDAIRVYMSATPYECLEHIIKYEREYQYRLNWNRPQYKDKSSPIVFYHFKRDYSYLDVKTYSSIAENLLDQIVKSVHRDKKRWLIFIDDKQKCADTKRQLEEYGEKNNCPLITMDKDGKVKTEKVLAVSAESKRKPAYKSIVKKEELSGDTYVLITTSVLLQ